MVTRCRRIRPKAKLYGTGGLGVLKAEISAEKHTRGAVSAVLQPNKPDSAGSQFFVCASDQPALDGRHTIFGRVSEGMDVVQQISEAPADAEGRPKDRIEIRTVVYAIRPRPSLNRSRRRRRHPWPNIARCSRRPAGPVTIEFLPDKAPEHVRNFLRLASAGVFDGTSFHRVVRGFVVQTGWLTTRGPLTEKQQKLVRPLAARVQRHAARKGILSMARGDDPASATTSFFIVTGNASSLDGKYTVFGRVVDGMSVIDAIEQTPLNGEAPVTRIDLKTVRIVRMDVGKPRSKTAARPRVLMSYKHPRS